MPIERPGFGAAHRALQSYFVHERTVGETLNLIAELANDAGPSDMVGLTLVVNGVPTTAVFTNPEAAAIDEHQYSSGSGPCLDAYRLGNVFRIQSTTEESRWPEFCRAAVADGVHSTLSLPIPGEDKNLGAFNMYATTERAFDDDDVERLTVFAEQAGIVLVNADHYWGARTLGENLKQAMETRAVIDQATGILMAPGGMTAEEAFQVLVQASQRENRKLREIAAEIVERTVQRTS